MSVKKILSETEFKKGISQHTKKLLMNWAIEANKIDKTRSISKYYTYFLDRYNGNSNTKISDDFFEDKPIEM